MTDKNVAREAKRLDDAFGVGGKIGDAVAIDGCLGLAPAAMIGGDDPVPVG